MGFNYQCKNCKRKVDLLNDVNVKKITSQIDGIDFEFTYFICDSCKTIEVVNIDNKATKKLLSALMFKLKSRETTPKGFKSSKKRLDNKRKALLYKYMPYAKSAFRSQPGASGRYLEYCWADNIDLTR